MYNTFLNTNTIHNLILSILMKTVVKSDKKFLIIHVGFFLLIRSLTTGPISMNKVSNISYGFPDCYGVKKRGCVHHIIKTFANASQKCRYLLISICRSQTCFANCQSGIYFDYFCIFFIMLNRRARRGGQPKTIKSLAPLQINTRTNFQ